RERILDAMVQFFENELLQLVRGFTLLGVDAGLREQGLGVDAGLFQQEPKAVILGRQDLLRGGAKQRARALRSGARFHRERYGRVRKELQWARADNRLQFGDYLL